MKAWFDFDWLSLDELGHLMRGLQPATWRLLLLRYGVL